MSFISDKLAGEAFELFVCDVLRNNYDIITYKNPDPKGIDLIGEANVEVKLDRRWKETGNFFIEYEYKGKPSGIQKYPHCTHFVVGDTTKFYVFTPEKLMSFCQENGRNINGGDGWRSAGWLIKVNPLFNVADFIYKKG